MKFKRPQFTKERVNEQVQEQAKDEPSEEALSLYDELFPEERRFAKERRRKAEEKLDKLPAFKWNVGIKPAGPVKKDRENESSPFRAILQSTDSALELALGSQQPLLGRPRGRREASVLILRAVSKTLEESDFFRVGSKGGHIEGWTSGLTKGIG
jgi:hypothetical protein